MPSPAHSVPMPRLSPPRRASHLPAPLPGGRTATPRTRSALPAKEIDRGPRGIRTTHIAASSRLSPRPLRRPLRGSSPIVLSSAGRGARPAAANPASGHRLAAAGHSLPVSPQVRCRCTASAAAPACPRSAMAPVSCWPVSAYGGGSAPALRAGSVRRMTRRPTGEFSAPVKSDTGVATVAVTSASLRSAFSRPASGFPVIVTAVRNAGETMAGFRSVRKAGSCP